MNSKILLVKNIHIDRQYTNVLSYSEAQMLELCQANLVAQADNYSFLRPTGSIMAGFTYSQCLQANYIAFQNKDYSNKWFFAWIDDVIYKGDKNTEITFTVDAWSTWFSNLTVTQSFVVREHVNDDVAGRYTQPEQLELGEYKIIKHLRDDYNVGLNKKGISNYYVVVASTIDLTTDNNVYCAVYNGVPTGVKYFKFLIDYSDPEGSPLANLEEVLYRLSSNPLGSKLDAILGMFIVPGWLANDLPNNSSDAKKIFTSITPLSDLDGYTPKNKKCLTYPYVYHLISNSQGQDAILKQEYWKKLEQNVTLDDGTILPAGDMELEMCGVITQGCSIRLIPINYNNDDFPSNYRNKFRKISASVLEFRFIYKLVN